jgi:hypothetical protein
MLSLAAVLCPVMQVGVAGSPRRMEPQRMRATCLRRGYVVAWHRWVSREAEEAEASKSIRPNPTQLIPESGVTR